MVVEAQFVQLKPKPRWTVFYPHPLEMDQWKKNGPLWMFLWPCLLWLYGIIRHRSQDIMRQVGQTLESNSIIMCIFAWVASWNIKDSYKKIDPWKKIVHKFARGSKQILFKNDFRSKEFEVPKILGPTKILVPKMFGLELFSVNKCKVKKISVPKNFCS